MNCFKSIFNFFFFFFFFFFFLFLFLRVANIKFWKFDCYSFCIVGNTIDIPERNVVLKQLLLELYFHCSNCQTYKDVQRFKFKLKRFEIQGRFHQKSKTGPTENPQKRLMSSKKLEKYVLSACRFQNVHT